jgi:hypothetical protein
MILVTVRLETIASAQEAHYLATVITPCADGQQLGRARVRSAYGRGSCVGSAQPRHPTRHDAGEHGLMSATAVGRHEASSATRPRAW